jgi:hypothetical protein
MNTLQALGVGATGIEDADTEVFPDTSGGPPPPVQWVDENSVVWVDENSNPWTET